MPFREERQPMLDVSLTVIDFLDADYLGQTAKAEKLARALETWREVRDFPASYVTPSGGVIPLPSEEELLTLIDKYPGCEPQRQVTTGDSRDLPVAEPGAEGEDIEPGA
jgi:hypothetical protein